MTLILNSLVQARAGGNILFIFHQSNVLITTLNTFNNNIHFYFYRLNQ